MPTLEQLDALANAVPQLNKKAASQASAVKTQQQRQQVGQAQLPPGVSTVRAAQAAAPQAVAGQAQVAVAAQQQTQQQLGQIAQAGLQTVQANDANALATQERTQREQLARQDMAQKLELSRSDLGMRKKVTGAEQAAAQRLQKFGIEMDNRLQLATIRQREQLNRLGGDAKDKILDSRLRFERDEMGRRFSNERQLADYAMANAKTEQEFASKMREMQQAHNRKIQMMEVAEKKLRQAMMQGFTSQQQLLDNQSRARIAKMAADMKEKIRKEKAKATGNAMMIQGAFTVAGAVVGGMYTGGTGTAAGAMVGASAGSAVGSMVAGHQGAQ